MSRQMMRFDSTQWTAGPKLTVRTGFGGRDRRYLVKEPLIREAGEDMKPITSGVAAVGAVLGGVLVGRRLLAPDRTWPADRDTHAGTSSTVNRPAEEI
jgi:hypothetical protein